MSEKEQQFERIYKETENFGRTQFVREIQMQINDNKKKDKEIERLNNIINEFENRLKRRIKAYEDRQALGKGYELTNVMEIQLTIDRKYLKELQELKGDGSNE